MSSWDTLLAPLLLRQRDSPVAVASEARIRSAYKVAEHLYAHHRHWTGVPLLAHTLDVLAVLLPFQPDDDTIIACLLQHVLSVHGMTLTEVEEQFGVSVRSILAGVHLLARVTMRHSRYSVDNLRLMLLSVSSDVRVLLIILCERCAVLEQSSALPPVERKRACRDVLGLFAPVAARLGIHVLKQRLEALAFPVVYPHDAASVHEQLEYVHQRFGMFLSSASEHLSREFSAHHITATVEGREKQPYSIFLKMKAKSLSHIDRLHDLFALRVIVQTEGECYQALGLLHRLGRPVANRFKDYIAFPKPNGYRSLHTTMARMPGVPDGIFLEVQVRSLDMHREAEYGIAVHWSYKEGGSAEHALQRIELQRILSSQHSVEGQDHKTSLADHIFVLTPKGDVLELPEGATPLDFAFQVHTQLGLTFRAARVNGRTASLDYELENGDVVEILSRRVPRPSPEWLPLLRMASARSRLKKYLASLHRSAYVARGKERFNAELQRRGFPLLDADLSVLKSYGGRTLARAEREDLLLSVGQETEKAATLLTRLDLLSSAIPALKTVKRRARSPSPSAFPVETVQGVPMPLRFAKCCKVAPADRIVGFVTRAGEVRVHRQECRMLQHANPERKVEVRWRE